MGDRKWVISIIQMNAFYTITEKYSLERVFIYNGVSPDVNLFLLQASCICIKYGH